MKKKILKKKILYIYIYLVHNNKYKRNQINIIKFS